MFNIQVRNKTTLKWTLIEASSRTSILSRMFSCLDAESDQVLICCKIQLTDQVTRNNLSMTCDINETIDF